MAGRGFLGCTGTIVGIGAALVIGWLSLDLLLTVWASVSGSGPTGPFRDAVVWHQIGQLAVFVGLIWAILGLVLRPDRVTDWLPAMRILLWVGAGFEGAAWLALPGGSRLAAWALILALLALPAPWVIRRAAGRPAK